nr:UDP-glycosyltransferase [Paris polyphylla]
MDLHVFFLPFLASGHMIPMVDIARLLADRGVKSTIVTTAGNIPRIQPTIQRFNSICSSDKPPIELLTIPFPSSVPDDFSLLPTLDFTPEFAAAISGLRQPFAELLESHRPDCIISDFLYAWTNDLGYPRIVFHAEGFFSCVAPGAVASQKLHESVTSDDEPFVVTGLPHRIEMTRSQLPNFFFFKSDDDVGLRTGVVESLCNSYGAVMNSFYELEPEYADIMKKNATFKIWHIGPVSLSRRNTAGESVESGIIRSWLDGKNPSSVLYVCFGSLVKFTTPQFREIASGLEDSGHPFIWVVKKNDGDILPEGFEERVKGKGLLIKGWAPQVMILNHPAIGGFMTHCGWNSCLEGVSAGLPMITWPMYTEQFFNEKLIVNVLGVGIAIGAKICSLHEEERTAVKGEVVAKAVRELLGSGEEAEGRRRRARKVGENAKRAVEEGGSSYSEMDHLVEDLINLKTGRFGSNSITPNK